MSTVIYPNPLNDKLNLILRDENPGDYLIELSELNGRIIFSLNKGFKAGGTKTVTFDFSEFSSGLYYLRLSDGKRLENRKVVKL